MVLGASSAHGESANLEVLHYGPSGVTDSLTAISIVFDQPMVGFEELDRVQRAGPLEFEPRTPGTFQWLGSNVLHFVPEPALDPGTRLICRVPAGTRAHGGASLAESVVWEIGVAPPKLLSAWPPLAKGASSVAAAVEAAAVTARQPRRPNLFDPWHDPLLLQFDREPAPGAVAALRLSGPEGDIGLATASFDSTHLALLAGGVTIDPRTVIAVRPTTPLQRGSSYRLLVPAEVPFIRGSLSLSGPTIVEFSTPAEPRILGARATALGLFLYPTNPIDPDSLRAVLHVTPAPPDLSVHARWLGVFDPLDIEEPNAILIRGSFPPGESVEVRVEPGLRDVFGLAARRPFAFQLVVPHRPAQLDLTPPDGVLIAGPHEFVRLRARNVGPVRVRVAWIRSPEMPLAYSESAERRRAGDPTARVPWEEHWAIDRIWTPGNSDGSAAVLDIGLSEVPAPPRDAQALWVEATAARIYREEAAADTLRAVARIQLGTLGISTAVGESHALIWATDLVTGRPLPEATVALHAIVEPETATEDAVDPVWTGRTDKDGLVWIPGAEQLDSLHVKLARVEVPGRRAWLALPQLRSTRIPGDDARAAVIVDRTDLEPGDRLQWKAWVRNLGAAGLSATTEKKVAVTFEGVGWAATLLRPLDLLGNATGSYLIPQAAAPGPLRIVVRDSETERALGSLELRITSPSTSHLEASLTSSSRRIVSGNAVTLQAKIGPRNGTALGPMPLAWDVSLEPFSWTPPGWEKFSFSDRSIGPAVPPDPGRAPARLDEGGSAIWKLSTPEMGAGSDLRVQVRTRPRDLHAPNLTAETSFEILRARIRVGVRAAQDRPEHRGAAAWEWVVLDTSGIARAGVSVSAVVYRLDETSPEAAATAWPDPAAVTEVYRRPLLSSTEPQTLAFTKPTPGLYALHLQVERTPGASALALSASDRSRAASPTSPLLVALREDEVTLPNTPAAGAQTLIVLHDRDLVRARSTFLRGLPQVSMPTADLLPPSVGVTAIQIGALPRGPSDAQKLALPAFAFGTATAPIRDTKVRPQLRLVPRSSGPDTVTVEIVALSPAGKPTTGEVVLGVYDADDSEPIGDHFDPLRSLLADRAQPIHWGDTRTALALSGSEAGNESPDEFAEDDADDADGAAASMPRARALSWIPSLRLGRDGRVLAHLPVGPRSHRYRVFAVLATPTHEFAYAEIELSGAPAARLISQLPEEVRVGDRVSLPITVHNRTDLPLTVWLGATLIGGRSEGSTEASHRLTPRSLQTVYLPITATETGTIGLDLALRAENAGGELLDSRQAEIRVTRPTLSERRVEPGSTTGRTPGVIELEDPLVQDAGGVRIVLAPSLNLELRDPLVALLESPVPGREMSITRLRATAALLALHSSMFELPTPGQLEAELARGLDLLEASPLLPDDEPRTRAYLDTYALWTLGELVAQGHRVDPELLTRTEQRILEWQGRGPESGRSRTEQIMMAFQSWVRIRFGHLQPDVDEIHLGQLLSRADQLGTVGRLCVALALDAYQRTGRASAPARVQIDSHLAALLAEMRDWAPDGFLRDEFTNGLPFSSSADDRMRSSALALTFLATRQPSHPLAARLLPWLLQQRREGTWPNPHEAALAAAAIQLHLSRVEQIHYPLQGRVVLGLLRTEGARFTADAPQPKVLSFPLEELARTRRPDPAVARLPIAFETATIDPMVYQVRIEADRDALWARPSEQGLTIFRRHLDPGTGRTLSSWQHGVPVQVEIWITSTIDTVEPVLLLLEHPVPPACELLEVADLEGGALLWSRLTGNKFRMVVRIDEPGTHPVRFTALARVPGEYGVPGSTIRTIYGPPANARSAATRIIVE